MDVQLLTLATIPVVTRSLLLRPRFFLPENPAWAESRAAALAIKLDEVGVPEALKLSGAPVDGIAFLYPPYSGGGKEPTGGSLVPE
jgi:hypothetical protein